jgi:hypothetical protein
MRKLMIFIVVLLSACSSSGQLEPAQPPRAGEIACYAVYRAGVDQPIESEERLVFTDSDASRTLTFDDLILNAEYSTGETDNERSLRLWVTEARDDSRVYQSNLYQLDPAGGPQNQFRGGHGFTGLTYGYHPESGAEIQYWCEAGG